jgi:hypothetical protein
MSFFDFLGEFSFFRPLRFERYPDSFATSRIVLYRRLMEVIQAQTQAQSTVFIAAHFPDEFYRLQSQLHQHAVDYRLITHPLDRQWFSDHKTDSQGVVYLALADFLSQTRFSGQEIFSGNLDLILVDRHPDPEQDDLIEAFARAFPATTKLGYFLALNDPVMQSVINETTLLVLKQMGIDKHGLISSGIISKRLTKVLIRESKRRNKQPQPADSIQQWYELNDNAESTMKCPGKRPLEDS